MPLFMLVLRAYAHRFESILTPTTQVNDEAGNLPNQITAIFDWYTKALE